MLLTIHNLPGNARYCDVKALINEKCNLTDVILDKLTPEGKCKKITVGVSSDYDANILYSKLNGLYVEGLQLYVKNIGQNKMDSNGQQFNKKSFMNYDQNNQTQYNSQQNNDKQYWSSNQMESYQNTNQNNQTVLNTYQSIQAGLNNLAGIKTYQMNQAGLNAYPPNQPGLNTYQNNQLGLNPYAAKTMSMGYNVPPNMQAPNANNYMGYNTQQQQAIPPLIQYPVPGSRAASNSYKFNRNDDNTRSNTDKSYTNRNSAWDQSNRNKGQSQRWDNNKGHDGTSKYNPEDTFTKNYTDSRVRKRPHDDHDSSRSGPGPAKFQRSATFRNPSTTTPEAQSSYSNFYGQHTTEDSKPNVQNRYVCSTTTDIKPVMQNVKKPVFELTPQEAAIKAANKDESNRALVVFELGVELLNLNGIPQVGKKRAGFVKIKKVIRKRLDEILDTTGLEPNEMKDRYIKRYPFSGDHQLAAVYSNPQEAFPAFLTDQKSDVDKKLFTKGDEIIYQGQISTKQPQLNSTPVVNQFTSNIASASNESFLMPVVKKERPAPISWVIKTPFAPKKPPKKGYTLPTAFLMPDKKSVIAQKQQMKKEFLSVHGYELTPNLKKALDKEMKTISDLFLSVCKITKDNLDEAQGIKKVVNTLGECEKAIKLHLIKRLLDIRTSLSLRIFTYGKRPSREAVAKFLAPYGVVSLKKAGNNKDFLVASCDSYQSFDKLSSWGTVSMVAGQTTISVKPLHLTMPIKYWNKHLERAVSEYNPPGSVKENVEFDKDLHINNQSIDLTNSADSVNKSGDSKSVQMNEDVIEIADSNSQEVIDVDALNREPKIENEDKDNASAAVVENKSEIVRDCTDNKYDISCDRAIDEISIKDDAVIGECTKVKNYKTNVIDNHDFTEDIDDIEVNEEDLEDY
ncbi:uncharacterized protein LOC131841454 [Achroia grisella]|uniref:uncharacterized protein LOC131841454 n=1 Tax=Achroia grisella TaxID=688607 RepID=UPI0027D28674|nr:uncharacterized protein LOC131841454 [Achroia grisella]